MNIYGSGYTSKGAPDLILIIDGRFVALELKVGDNDMQPDQRIHKMRIERSGGMHYVPRSLNDVKKIIEELQRG